MNSPPEIFDLVQSDEIFRMWAQKNPLAYPSHFFSSLSPNFEFKSNWDFGYFNPKDDKITVFSLIDDHNFEIRPADDVFKLPGNQVEKLELNQAKISYDEALTTLKSNIPDFFPKETLGDGFVVLQNIGGKTIWNFSFISRSLKFLNLKIDAGSGKINSHETIELVERK